MALTKQVSIALVAGRPELGALLHPRLPYNKATIIWAVQEEMCMTIEDALSRRTRALLLDAKAAIEAAPLVAELMAAAMKQGPDWIQEQLTTFYAIAKHYLPEKANRVRALTGSFRPQDLENASPAWCRTSSKG